MKDAQHNLSSSSSESSLARSERNYRMALESLGDAVHVVDHDLRIVLANKTFLLWNERLGLTADMAGKTIFDLFPFLGEEVREEYEQVFRTGEPLVTQERTEVTGMFLNTETRKIPIFSGDHVDQVLTVIRDVTEHQRMSEALAYRAEFHRLISTLSTSFVRLAPADLDDAINDALRRIGEFAGVDRSYVFQFSDHDERMDNTHEWCAEGIEPQMDNLRNLPVKDFLLSTTLLEESGVLHVPRVADLPDGSAEKEEFEREGIRSVLCIPMMHAGKMIGFVGFDSVREEKVWAEEIISLLNVVGVLFANVLSRKREEEMMLESSRLEVTTRLAGGIAHEFNNLMTGVLGNAELLKLDLGDDPRRAGMVDAIAQSAQRAGELAHQMLAFARGGKYQPKVLNMNDVVAEVLDLRQGSFPAWVDVTRDFADDLWNVEADPAQMRQVVINLCNNAIEAVEGKGRVTIRTRNCPDEQCPPDAAGELKPGPCVCLTIIDTGPGMEPETLAHVFEPFYTTKSTGRGLGLAATYGIVKNHGGHISVRSELGVGTTFVVHLPAVEKAVDETPETPKQVPRGTRTLLIIDDEQAVLDVTRRLVERLGHGALTAADGQHAVEIARTHEGDIDLAVLDIGMPLMDGAEVYPLLKKARPDMKVILSSGYELDAISQALLDAGADAFIQKPFRMKALGDTIREVLGR